MRKNRCIVIILSIFIFALVKINIGLAYEREIVFGEEYQSKKEKEQVEKRFGLDLSFGYGYSYIQFLTGIYGIDSKEKIYYNRLGLDYSNSSTTFRVTGSVLATPRLGFYAGSPFGLVSVKQDRVGRLGETQNLEFGVGDIYTGGYYQLVTETKTIPSVVVNFDVNSNTAKYSSLGDGVWDFTPAVQARKMLTNSFYVFGLEDYTYRKKENGVDPGDIIGYGGGVGVFFGRNAVELGLKAANIEKTKLDGATWFDKGEDLALNFRWGFLDTGGSVNVNIGNLDEGFDIKTNTFGIEITFPIF